MPQANLTATVTIEINLDLTAVRTPAEPDVGIMGEGVEDVDIEDVWIEKVKRIYKDGVLSTHEYTRHKVHLSPEAIAAIGEAYGWDTLAEDATWRGDD